MPRHPHRFCREQVKQGTSCQAVTRARRDCEEEDLEAEDFEAHSGRDPIEVAYTEAQLAADLLRRVCVTSGVSPTSRPSQRLAATEPAAGAPTDQDPAWDARLRAHGERGLAAVSTMLQCSHEPVLPADSAPPSPEARRSSFKSLKMMPFSRLRSLMPSMRPARAAHVPKEPKASSSKSSLVSRLSVWKRGLRSLHKVEDSSQESYAEGYVQILENFNKAVSVCPGNWHQTGAFKNSSESACSTASTMCGESED